MLSAPRINHAAAVLQDGRVLIAGGFDGNGALSSVDLFDPATGAVSGGPTLFAFREGLSATTLLDGNVLIAGGHNIEGDQASADMYDPTSNTISPTTSWLTTARRDHLAFLLPHNNNVLIVGGTSGGTALSSAELFAPWQDMFSPTGSMSVARSGAAGSPLAADGLLVIAGGRGRASAELYGFATVKTDKPKLHAGRDGDHHRVGVAAGRDGQPAAPGGAEDARRSDVGGHGGRGGQHFQRPVRARGA